MGTESIVNMAKRLGLNDKTGIELNEVATGVPTEKAKIDGLKRELKNALYANAESYFTKEVYSNIKRLDKDINTIVSWMGTEKITYAKMNICHRWELKRKNTMKSLNSVCMSTLIKPSGP